MKTPKKTMWWSNEAERTAILSEVVRVAKGGGLVSHRMDRREQRVTVHVRENGWLEGFLPFRTTHQGVIRTQQVKCVVTTMFSTEAAIKSLHGAHELAIKYGPGLVGISLDITHQSLAAMFANEDLKKAYVKAVNKDFAAELIVRH